MTHDAADERVDQTYSTQDASADESQETVELVDAPSFSEKLSKTKEALADGMKRMGGTIGAF